MTQVKKSEPSTPVASERLKVVAGQAKPQTGDDLTKAVPIQPPLIPGQQDPARKRSPGDAKVAKAIRIAKRKRQRLVTVSFALMVALPTLLGALYYAFFAADQYAASAQFAVRGREQISADIVGLMTGAASSTANVADSYIVQEFVLSREMVERLERSIGVRAIYAHPDADWYARFPQEKPVEEFMDYWRSMVNVEFDHYSSIISLEVRAFTARDAEIVAAAVVRESEMLVNRLSEQSRLDAVAFAQRELGFAEESVREARNAVTAFQAVENTVDPRAVAESHETLVAELEAGLAKARTELAEAQTFVGPDAPTIRIIKTRIAALQSELDRERTRVANRGGTSGEGGISGQLQAFGALKTEAEFAEKRYVSALAAVEVAKAEAKRSQRYLATFVAPTQPGIAVYPRRIVNTLLVALAAMLIWGISGLLLAAVKDHTH
jgi:capsular polysaccharide transport system permease protein